MAELQVPRLDFSTLAELPQVYQKSQNEAVKRQTLQDLNSGRIDQAQATQRLLAADPQLGMSLAQLSNNNRDFGFRQTEAERAQKNTEAQLALQRQQIAATAGNTAASQALARQQFEWQKEQGNRPDIREVTDENGNKKLVLVDRKANAVQPVTVPGQATEQNNPFLTGGALNESQSNAATYASRMLASEKVLRGVEGEGTNRWEQAKSTVSDRIGYNLRGDQFQKFDQARRDFTTAVLRKESGAVISKSEEDNANRQYFPQPGDTKEVIEQKRRNRAEAIRGIGAAAGKGYRPSLSIDQAGNIVERGQPQQAASGPVQVTSQQQRDALAPGTQYVAPDGSIRTKQ